MVFAIRKISVLKKEENTILEIRKIDCRSAKTALCIYEFAYFLLMIQTLCGKFEKKIFLEVHEKLRTKNIPWITSGIKKLIKKDKLKRKAILTNLEND